MTSCVTQCKKIIFVLLEKIFNQTYLKIWILEQISERPHYKDKLLHIILTFSVEESTTFLKNLF